MGFKPNDLVVCINDSSSPRLKQGQVYTVSFCQEMINFKGWVKLLEDDKELAYDDTRFRKASIFELAEKVYDANT